MYWPTRLALAGAALTTVAFADCNNPADRGCEVRASVSSIDALQTPLAALHSYLQQRGLDPNSLTVAGMVDVMLDWYRLVPIVTQGEDQLIFRYSGWSEGCATAFKLSLLRRIATGDDSGERLAGITMMFEPSNQSELLPFSAQSSDATSLEAFAAAIKRTAAYQRLGSATPLAVLVETGGVR
jgi:hypothetical protein